MTDPFAQPKDRRTPSLVGQLDEHLQRQPKPQPRCPDCGAFCRPLWLKGGLGTDPKWECKNCGART